MNTHTTIYQSISQESSKKGSPSPFHYLRSQNLARVRALPTALRFRKRFRHYVNLSWVRNQNLYDSHFGNVPLCVRIPRVGNRSTISRELTDRHAGILGHRSTPSSDFSEPTLSSQKSVNACRGKFPTGLPEIRRKCNGKSIYQRLAVRFLLHFTLRCNRNQKK